MRNRVTLRAYRMISTNRTQALNMATSMERITPAANGVTVPGSSPQSAKPDHRSRAEAQRICRATDSLRPTKPELHHIRTHAVKLPFAQSGRLSVVKLTVEPS